MNQEKNIKSELLGEIQKLSSGNSFVPNLEALQSPFRDKEAKVKSFCCGCGSILEISESGAERLKRMAKVESIENGFFQTIKCISCADDFEGVTFIKFNQ